MVSAEENIPPKKYISLQSPIPKFHPYGNVVT